MVRAHWNLKDRSESRSSASPERSLPSSSGLRVTLKAAPNQHSEQMFSLPLLQSYLLWRMTVGEKEERSALLPRPLAHAPFPGPMAVCAVRGGQTIPSQPASH